MRPGLFSIVLASGLVAGCDVAVVAGLAVSGSRDKSSGSPAAAPEGPPPDTAYHVWIASLADAPAASAQETALTAASGVPDGLVWTEVGSGTGSAVFDPAQPAGSFNSILIQAGDAQVHHLDAVEVLAGLSNMVVETGTAPVYSGQVTVPANAAGVPDGVAADLVAAAGTRAFLFTRFAGPIDKFRVNVWGAAQGPGDVVWTSTWPDAGNETAGGAAVDAAGTVYVTVSDAAGANRDIRLLRFDSTGGQLLATLVSSPVSAAEGSHAVAVHTDGSVYVAATVGAGTILVRKYTAGLASTDWSVTVPAAFGVDRVEANSISVDSAGDAIVSGGVATLANGIDPWIRKFASGNGGTLWTQTPPALPVDSADTWWHATALDSFGEVYSSGDLTSTASGFVEIVTRRSASGTGAAVWSDLFGDSQAPPDLGRAIGVYGAGNVYSAGFSGTGTQGRNGVILKYISGGFLTSFVTFDDQNALDDEVMDIAVEPDGTVYAAGYETVAGQGQNLWVRKYNSLGVPVWTRTYDGGAGDDRAASLVVTGNFVVVVGNRTEAGGETNIHVRRYVK